MARLSMASMVRYGIAACAAWTVLACADLTPIDAGICGNGITEPDAGEACDGDEGCQQPDQTSPCRYRCDGEAACPEGYGCGDDGLCRRARGAFERAAEVRGPPASLRAADLDRDGDADLVSDTGNAVRLELFAAGTLSAPETSFDVATVGRHTAAPALGDLDADGLPDLALSLFAEPLGGGLAVLRSPGEEPLSAIYPNLEAPKGISELELLSARVFDDPDAVFPEVGDEQLLRLETQRSGTRLVGVGDLNSLTDSDEVVLLAQLEASVTAVAVGDVDQATSCEEVVAAPAGAAALEVLATCRGSDPVWNVVGDPGWVSYPPVALASGQLPKQDAAVEVVDLNGDGHRDLVALAVSGGQRQVHVAYGRGDGSFHSEPGSTAPPDQAMSPWPVAVAEGGTFAVGDFDGDGSPAILAPCKQSCEAVVGDFDGSGTDDVAVAGQGQPVLVSRGHEDGSFTSRVAGGGAAHDLLASDFDGDGLTDLAFFESTDEGEAAFVAFGDAAEGLGAPSPIGTLRPLRSAVAGRLVRKDGARDLMVVVSGPDDSGLQAAVIFGSPERILSAPFSYREVFRAAGGTQPPEALVPVATSYGAFGDDGAGLAVVTRDGTDASGSARLWRLRASENAVLGAALAPASQGQSTELSCDGCVLLRFDLLEGGAEDVVLVDGSSLTGYRVEGESFAEIGGMSLDHAVDEATAQPTYGDFDGDGRTDAALLSDTGALVALFGHGDGSLPNEAHLEGPFEAVTSLAGDRDAEDELLLADAEGLWLVNAASEQLMEPQAVPIAGPSLEEGVTSLAAGDFDGDGINDVAVGRAHGYTLLRGEAVLP